MQRWKSPGKTVKIAPGLCLCLCAMVSACSLFADDRGRARERTSALPAAPAAIYLGEAAQVPGVPNAIYSMGAGPRLNVIDLPQQDIRFAQRRANIAQTAGAALTNPANVSNAQAQIPGQGQVQSQAQDLAPLPVDLSPDASQVDRELARILSGTENGLERSPLHALQEAPASPPNLGSKRASASAAKTITASTTASGLAPGSTLCDGAPIVVHENGGGLRAATLTVDGSIYLPAGSLMCGTGEISGLQSL